MTTVWGPVDCVLVVSGAVGLGTAGGQIAVEPSSVLEPHTPNTLEY